MTRSNIPPEAARAAREQLDAMRARAAAKQTPAPLQVLREVTAKNVAKGGAIYEQTEPAHERKRDQGTNPVKVSCGCRSVRVFPSALALGPITCGACGSDFE